MFLLLKCDAYSLKCKEIKRLRLKKDLKKLLKIRVFSDFWVLIN